MMYGTLASTIDRHPRRRLNKFGGAGAAHVPWAMMVGTGNIDKEGRTWGVFYDKGAVPGLLTLVQREKLYAAHSRRGGIVPPSKEQLRERLDRAQHTVQRRKEEAEDWGRRVRAAAKVQSVDALERNQRGYERAANPLDYRWIFSDQFARPGTDHLPRPMTGGVVWPQS